MQKRKRIRIFLSLLLFLGVLSNHLPETSTQYLYAQSELSEKELYSTTCALMDGYSGRILFGKKETTPRANASTTKILTCIIALEEAKPDDMVTASRRAVRQPKVRLGMKEGQKYKMKDLLYCLMLESYNDCAVAIAEKVGGSVEKFAEKMNQKAKEIGCKDSYFITPNGLDEKDKSDYHHTTARDLCKIMQYCVWESSQKDLFLKITQRKQYTFSDEQSNTYVLNNHNQLLNTMQGAISGKTGFTADAGYCYVMAYEREGKRFCVALLGCGWPNQKNYKWKDAKKIIDFAVETFKCCTLYSFPPQSGIKKYGSYHGQASWLKWKKPILLQPYIHPPEKIKRYMVKDTDRIHYRITSTKKEKEKGKEEIQIGRYQIFLGTECVENYEVYVNQTLKEWNLWDILRLVVGTFLLS